MRNISLIQTTRTTFESDLFISAIALDLDENLTYVATEHQTPHADVTVQVRKVETDGEYREDHPVVTSSRFQAYLASNPWSSPYGKPHELVSFKLLLENRTLVLVMRGGDIATAPLDESPVTVDIVGNIDAGILAASWSPDDTLLVLVTGDDKLILMTSTFDVVSETALQRQDFGEDAPINVGWGSKQTQFHGSLGKAAAQAPKPSIVGPSPDEDELPRISWRGDGAYFVVSTLSSGDAKARALRIYSHAGVLHSTSEPTPGLEHVLSWRPSGNWIVGTQRYGFPGGGEGRAGRHDVVMFERNGLKRLDFSIQDLASVEAKLTEETPRKWAYRVREASWSSDSNVLSLWIEKDSGDVVQLWTIGNYHWYLKHEIMASNSSSESMPARFTTVTWHPEDPGVLFLTTPSEIIRRKYIWDTFISTSYPPHDSGTVAVIDGSTILLTPFRTQNVPPPMASYQLPLTAPPANAPRHQSRLPIHVVFSPTRDVMAALWETGYIELTDLRTRLGPGRGKIMDPIKLWAGYIAGDESAASGTSEYRQIQILGDHIDVSGEGPVTVVALGSASSQDGKDAIMIVNIEGGNITESVSVDLPQRGGRMVPSDNQVWWQSPNGELLSVDKSTETALPVSSFKEYCPYTRHIDSPALLIGLTTSSHLYVANMEGSSQQVAANVNSFTIASGYLVWTSTAHMAHFAPVTTLADWLMRSALKPKDIAQPEWETRRVERGSRIVTAVPSTMSLVLQMPRGNLETINPRPLVMEIVKQDIDRHNYAKAFSACRRHRIDLNVFAEHNKEEFITHLPDFLEQVNDVDYINLFLTSIGQGTLPDAVVNGLCDGIRTELEKKDLKTYINSVLTAHVMKRPSDHEAGLASLLVLRETEPQLVEDAVKYIIFLVDADRLFDIALGMYDFSLVLMIAQHAQKDPREYLPFLRELRAMEKFYQRFKIDDHLRRHSKALQNLSLAGPERLEEAFAYTEKHQLYDTALSIWKGTEHYNARIPMPAALEIYGDWLFERREFRDAAFVFRQAEKYEKAMLAYEKALEWQDLFDVALQQQISKEDLQAAAYRVAEDLSSKKRYQEAAIVLLDYAKDVREAVIALVQGNLFSEARRVITLNAQPELLEEIVYPGALESRTQIAEDLTEMREQLRKQIARVRELRVKKVEEPDAFYGAEDVDLHNVDVMTDVSMAPTTFTRYTVAPSALSKASSKRSSRSKRKMERKVGSGRKGTVDEEEYLLRSVTKLVVRFNATQVDATHLLPHLFQLSVDHHAEGLLLQADVLAFKEELNKAVEEIWTKTPQEAEEGVEATLEGWSARMKEYERQRRIDALEKVAKPDIGKEGLGKRMGEV
ncbi:pol II transcription elongation factor [Irpex rosettiformis]|uniref:Pol II transcription elongation factor n=1 Tax=Irpex rosettiformis TaxID=378272 RepID=A0ACB8U988_9APHY|nr:pol II transcription elongation factor [Irpex rosettiformis]